MLDEARGCSAHWDKCWHVAVSLGMDSYMPRWAVGGGRRAKTLAARTLYVWHCVTWQWSMVTCWPLLSSLLIHHVRATAQPISWQLSAIALNLGTAAVSPCWTKGTHLLLACFYLLLLQVLCFAILVSVAYRNITVVLLRLLEHPQLERYFLAWISSKSIGYDSRLW